MSNERIASALEGIAHTLGWIAFWLFIISFNTCNAEVVVP